MTKATDKMKSFAEKIAEKLGIDEPAITILTTRQTLLTKTKMIITTV